MQDRLGDKIRLLHIVDAINEIENYIQDTDLKGFVDNSMMFNASLRQLEIIGEASNRLSEKLLNSTPSIPWARIIICFRKALDLKAFAKNVKSNFLAGLYPKQKLFK